ncbi:MAG: response regulator [Deltaproteobacteria bacterium]|nr:response regulator [Deltaproteobacteria bacterium]
MEKNREDILHKAADAAEKSKPRVLVADDDKFMLAVYADLIKEAGYDCLLVNNGLEAIEKAPKYRPDIIITDVLMPGMDGFEVTRRLKADPLTLHIPVLIVTSLLDRASKVKGLECGADELLNKPVDETEFNVRVKNLLKVKKFEDYLLEHGATLEHEVESKTLQLEKAFEKIKYGYTETVYRLTLAAEYRDKETGGHIKRISLYSQLLARYLGLTESQVEAIFFASPMHDVGKIGIPDAVLLKQGRLTPEEMDIMKTHTTIGAGILRDSDSEILKAAQEVALTHHESWDGKGYPQGLKGEDIPMTGRIVHIVDIYDALRSKRPYKAAIDHAAACGMIAEEKDRHDPVIYKAFENCADEFRRLFDENRDGEERHDGAAV